MGPGVQTYGTPLVPPSGTPSQTYGTPPIDLEPTTAVTVTLRDVDPARLAAALAQQYGKDVQLHVVVDQSLIGGLRVEIGDDLIDGTVVSRLDEAGRRLAG